jgi:hypothetical protein
MSRKYDLDNFSEYYCSITYVFELAEWSKALRVIESRLQRCHMKILKRNLR